jgi:hypothetical protein
MFRKYAVALCIVALVAGSIKPVQAAPAEVLAASNTALGTAGSITVGFIGAVAVVCLFDLVWKVQGLKNWDGTPKKGVKLPF